MQPQRTRIADDDRDRYTIAVAMRGVDPTPCPKHARTRVDTGFRQQASVNTGQPSPSSPRGRCRRRRSEYDQGWRDAIIWCGIPVIIVLLLRIFLFGFYAIPSGSMKNTIEPGDRVITTKLAPDYIDLQRGDIIVFQDPAGWLQSESSSSSLLSDNYLIKRLIGLPGDIVECDGAGSPVKINGVAIDESAYLPSGVNPSDFSFYVEVTEGYVFVMGDNRSNSADSRYHQNDGANGLVPISDIVGKAIATYWPLNRIGVLDSHHEVFADVPDGTTNDDE